MGLVHELQKRLMLDFFEVETNESLSADDKVQKIISITCIGCAGVAATPIPVADFFVLTPIQGYMGFKIARVRGVHVTMQSASETVKQILSVIGLGFIGRQIAVSTLKFIPFFGSIANIPVVYGLTYAVGRAMDYYFSEKAAGREVSNTVMRGVFADARQAGESAGELWAKAQAGLARREKEITRSFLLAKDRFVRDARETFEKTYTQFLDAIREPSKEKTATPSTAKPKRPRARKKASTAAKPRSKKKSKTPDAAPSRE